MDTWVVYFHDWKQHSLRHEFRSEDEALRDACQLRLAHHIVEQIIGPDRLMTAVEIMKRCGKLGF
jgi:hypothetical protein